MGDLMTRSFSDMEVRAAKDGRTVEGIVVPYDYAQRIDEKLVEQFQSGAFDHQFGAANRIHFTRNHQSHGGEIIGNAREMRNDARGLYMRFYVSDIPLGNDTLVLMRDEVLTDLSVGFFDRFHRNVNGVTVRTRADLFEVSVVPQGAYGEQAKVLAVRQEQQTPRLESARRLIAGFPVLPPLV